MAFARHEQTIDDMNYEFHREREFGNVDQNQTQLFFPLLETASPILCRTLHPKESKINKILLGIVSVPRSMHEFVVNKGSILNY